MMGENKQRIKVTTDFIDLDGSKGTRSELTDFRTLQSRIFNRIQKAHPESEPILIAGINSYNMANYESALTSFTETTDKFPSLCDELAPHIEICKRVLEVRLNPDDSNYEESMAKWNGTSKVLRMFKSEPEYKIKCKYCGHYTPYHGPIDGLAYLDTNNCGICGRGYPAPDFAWDGMDGQAYIYYRNSVKEAEFYREFESRYEVNPDHTHFLEK